MLEQIKPYVGQVVLFMPTIDDSVGRSNHNDDYIPAIITRIWSPGVVNLKIIPDCGPMQDRTSVSHISFNTGTYHFKFINTPKTIPVDNNELLVSFGNYLLSERREKNTSEAGQRMVNHADLLNWKEEEGLVEK